MSDEPCRFRLSGAMVFAVVAFLATTTRQRLPRQLQAGRATPFALRQRPFPRSGLHRGQQDQGSWFAVCDCKRTLQPT